MTQWLIGCIVVELIILVAVWLKLTAAKQSLAQAVAEKDAFADKQRTFEELVRKQAASDKEIELLRDATRELPALREQLGRMSENAVRLETEKANLAQSKTQLEQEKDKLMTLYKSEFKAISTEILNTQIQLFKQGNKEQMEQVVSPLNEKLAEFKAKVEAFSTQHHSDKNVLNEKIHQIEQVARDFVGSLKSPAGSGIWGEHTVRELLESMSFQKGNTYFEQETHNDKRPDFLVRLPNNRFVVIDAKTIYSEYESYMREPDVTKQQKHLKDHAAKVRTTITSLHERKYQNEIASFCKKLNLPEDQDPVSLVLMFVNPEGALAAALMADPSLLQWASSKQVVLVSAATLAGALFVIQTLWANNRKDEDYAEMTRLAQSLVNGFGQFLATQTKVTDGLNKALEEHHHALKIIGSEEDGLLKDAQSLANLAPYKIAESNITQIKKGGYSFTGKPQNGSLVTH